MDKSAILLLLSLAVGILFFPFSGRCQVELRSDEGEPGARFGSAVSLWGAYALVGEPGNNGAGQASGAAYLYQQSGGGRSRIAVLRPDDAEAHQRFGHSVSICGDQIIIGAFNHGEKGYGAGAAYIFERDGEGWGQTARLTADFGSANDNFGYSVGISENRAIVGAPREDGSGTDSGAVYIFEKGGAGWYQAAKLIPENHDGNAGDMFGRAVAIDGDGAAVGAHRHSSRGLFSGAVYLFRRGSSGWLQETKLMPNGISEGDFFGESVSLSGDRLLVGASGDDDRGTDAGAAYLCNRQGTVWADSAKWTAPDGAAGDHFGRQVGLSGIWGAVGADGKDGGGLNAGTAYLFKESSPGTWQHQSEAASAAPGAGDRYGSSVAVRSDGGICNIIVGAPGDNQQGEDAGAAYGITHGQPNPDIRVSPTELTLYTASPTSPSARARAAERSSLIYARARGLEIPASVRNYWRSADVRPPRLPSGPSLPSSVDWSQYDSPAKSQGSCGSCWVFAAVGLVENLANQAGIRGNVDLSEQAAVSCIGKGCGGAWAWDAFDYIRGQGLPPEECYPFTGASGNCDDRCQTPQYTVKISDFTPKGGLWPENHSPEDLKAALRSGPLAVCMRVPDDGTFEGSGYQGGVYDYNGGEISWSDQGHVVLLVGYDDNLGCFKVKNSWGPNWGENGYFRIAYDDVTDDVKFGSYAARAEGAYIDGRSATVTVYNEGGAPLTIYGIESSDTSWLSFSPSGLSSVPPDGQEILNVFVTQNLTTEKTGTITIESNDPDDRFVSVSVRAIPGAETNYRLLGNINGDRLVDLTDALIALRVLSGIEDDRVIENYADSGADVNGDGRVGPEEVIFILRDISK